MCVDVESLKIQLDSIEAKLDKLLSSEKTVEVDEKMNTTKLCEYLGVNRITIHNMKKRGAIPYYGNRKYTYFMKSEIDAALSSISKKKKR